VSTAAPFFPIVFFFFLFLLLSLTPQYTYKDSKLLASLFRVFPGYSGTEIKCTAQTAHKLPKAAMMHGGQKRNRAARKRNLFSIMVEL
jgi:hypothetical protein